MTVHTGRHFLQIPGPTNVPDRVLRAMDMPTMDHRGAEFAELGFAVMAAMQRVFRTKQPVMIYPSSGTGAWEAAIVNTLSPGDKVLMCETGQFAVLWLGIADKFKLDVDFMPGDWRHGADLEQIEARLAADRQHKIKAVMVVHNETSTGCVTHPLEVRKILDRTKHPALLMVDTISGLGSLEYEHDAWGIDVSVGRLAEGPDAAAGPRLQRGLGKGAGGREGQPGDAVLLGLAGGHRHQQGRHLALHAGDQSAVRPAAKRSRCSRRRGWRMCSPATSATARRRARRSRPGGWKRCARSRARIRPR